MSALAGLRICDLSGQLAGAGATRTLAAFGAEVIRVEDPVKKGQWDILRGVPPFVDERRGNELGGGFNNHNAGKLGATINARVPEGRELLAKLISVSDVVTENFSAGVLESWGFGYEAMRELKPDLIYVSNCGFGHTGPYSEFRTWGPIVQAVCGLTLSSRLADQPSAGYGYSYMDHHGANLMAFAILAALHHRDVTGEGQWIDMSTMEAGTSMLGPAALDWSANGNPVRKPKMSSSNRSEYGAMAPHGVFEAKGEDEWVAIACRDDSDWAKLAVILGDARSQEARWSSLEGRIAAEDELEELVGAWTGGHEKFDIQTDLLAAGIPAAAVQTPPERIDSDPSTSDWGLWPLVAHPEIGDVRVDGIPMHLSDTDWSIEAGAPLLGQHNNYVFATVLGLTVQEIQALEEAGAV